MIGPSHGVIWRSFIPKIIDEYKKWSANQTVDKALIVYDTMWGSTEKMAFKLQEGLEEKGVPAIMRNIKTTHISSIVSDVLESKAIIIGSPTLNNGMLPTVGAFLTYIKGLKPKGRIGLAFGSFGWGGQAPGEIEKVMQDLKWEIPIDKIKIKYIPDDDEYGSVKETGMKLAEHIKK
jgi:flavorubredoxin